MSRLFLLLGLWFLTMPMWAQVKEAPVNKNSNTIEIALPGPQLTAQPISDIKGQKNLSDKELNDQIVKDLRPQPNFLNPPKSNLLDVQIGTGTIKDLYPIDPYYGYSYTQNIYLASEIGYAGQITKIKYYFAGSDLSKAKDWVVYMGHTTKTSFTSTTDWIPVAQLTEVFNGSITWAANSWIEITLTTPFNYNGTDNLVIAVDENTPQYNSTSDRFYCSTVTGNRGIRYRSDYTNPDPANPPTADAIEGKIANIIISITPNIPYQNNLKLGSIDDVPSLIPSGQTITPKVTVVNFGQNLQDTFDVYLTILNANNDTVYADTVAYRDTIQSLETMQFTFDNWTPADGEYTLVAEVKIMDGVVDENPSDDVKQLTTLVGTIVNMQNGQTSTCNALFYDSGGPNGDYSNNENLTYTFLPASPNAYIKVEFLSFVTELNYDSLMIYDAANTNSGYLGKWHGTNSPGTIIAQNPSGALTFKFKSDNIVVKSGWAAKVTCFIPPQHDLAVVDVKPKMIIFKGNAVKPKVKIKNVGLNEEANWSVTVTSKTGYSSTIQNLATIPSMGIYEVEMDDWTPAPGTDTLTAVVTVDNDENHSNDTLAVTVYILEGPTFTLNATQKTYNIINLANGQENQILTGLSTTPFPMAEEYDGNYVYRILSGMTIGTVEVGQYTPMGTITGATGTPTGLAYDWLNDKWYMTIINSNNQTGLFELNMSTLQVTQIGSYASPMIIGIDVADDGFIYGPSINDDKLYKIDPQTGTFTEIGAVGLDLNYGQDVTWDPIEQKLYTITCLASGTNAFGYYDLQTGAFTQILAKGTDQYATIVNTREPIARYPITFHVTDGTNPLVNAKITVGQSSFYTDQDGYVTKKYPDGTYNFTVEKYGFAQYTGQFTVSGAADTVEVEMTALPSYTATIVVKNAADQLLANAQVVVKQGQLLLGEGTTNDQGQFEVPGLVDGSYDYTVTLAEYNPANGTFDVNGADTTVDVTLTEIIWMPYGLLAQQLNNEGDVKLSWNNDLGFFDDIESYTAFEYQQIGNYTLYDGDGGTTYGINNISFPNQNYVGAAIVFKPSETTPPLTATAWQPYSGLQYIAFFNSETPPDNNWLITPKVTAAQGMKFSFWAKSVTAQYGLERMKVGVSTAADPLPVSNYTFITPSPYVEVPIEWTYYEYDLSTYAGQDIYLAINCVSNDAFVLMVDDIKVGFNTPKSAKPVVKYRVYLDGDFVGETTNEEYIYENLQNGEYTGGVEGVFITDTSEMAMVNFTVSGVVNNKEIKVNYVVYPNPTTDFVSVMYKGTYRVELTDLSGKRILTTNAQNFATLDLRKLNSGVYMLKIYSDKDQYVTKIIKK